MRRRALTATLAALAMLAAACGGSGGGRSTAEQTGDPAEISGDITVLTQRTDLKEDGTLAKYAAEFNKTYPNVQVKFEALTDYEGEVKIRMNTENYGDVLLIPAAVAKNDYPKFFASLGSAGELSKKYKFTSASEVNGQVYGVVSFAAANGFIYNKDVWTKAGVTGWPKTPAEFLADLQAVKSKTGATPLYTNYKDGWPLTAWTNVLGSATCDPQAKNALAKGDPWAAGKDLNVGDSLLFNAVKSKLTEADPTTTNWEESKGRFAKGDIATMWLGSWAIPQMRDAAAKAGVKPEAVGFMPFPAQVDGKFCAALAPDYRYAVNTHSEHKAAARAWVDWMVGKSGFAALNEGVSPVTGDPLPAALKPYQDAGVRLLDLDQAGVAQVNDIDRAAEIGLDAPDYRKNLVDVARGAAKGDLNALLADLSKKWDSGRKTVG
ncbi:extracellular solute-binding protein [Actinomadura darangshiensis]|uniref:Extracellular solute-binding protein n=1 Tax=Actinomadura darangshiensis TaxID=705336 RepID=A0A4R5B2A8_9ACTN|nr:extracellular solute-binding protein [Actinomadura darangshiensis]TDD77684.1 extracellular solute-binding protein [Actinomadura darangshiensis]